MNTVGEALVAAGAERLSPAQKAYLASRLALGAQLGGWGPRNNPAGLRLHGWASRAPAKLEGLGDWIYYRWTKDGDQRLDSAPPEGVESKDLELQQRWREINARPTGIGVYIYRKRWGRHIVVLDTMSQGDSVGGVASFGTLLEGARAAVATAYRAAPRSWGDIGADELARLGQYPLLHLLERRRAEPFDADSGQVTLRLRDGGYLPVPLAVALRAGATRRPDDSLDLTAVAPLDLGWWPGFGPSSEAETTFRGLIADWEAFERLGVGRGRFAFLAQDVKEWREFRDAWNNAALESADIGGRLTAEVARANRIRVELKDARVVDPQLRETPREGVDVTAAAAPQAVAKPIADWAASTPGVSWLTDPKAPPKAIGQRLLLVAGGSILAVVLLLSWLSKPQIMVVPTR